MPGHLTHGMISAATMSMHCLVNPKPARGSKSPVSPQTRCYNDQKHTITRWQVWLSWLRSNSNRQHSHISSDSRRLPGAGYCVLQWRFSWVVDMGFQCTMIQRRDGANKEMTMSDKEAVLLREIEQWFEFYLAWSTEITTQGRGMVKGILTSLREALNDAKGDSDER